MLVEDYPRDLLEFEARFASEGACRDYLSALRWPEGFRCPGCGHERAWPVRNLLPLHRQSPTFVSVLFIGAEMRTRGGQHPIPSGLLKVDFQGSHVTSEVA